MIQNCNRLIYDERLDPTPPRVETQTIRFEKLQPTPEPLRIQIVRCNRFTAFVASGDGRSIYGLISWDAWDREPRVYIDNTVFHIAIRFPNIVRLMMTTNTEPPRRHERIGRS